MAATICLCAALVIPLLVFLLCCCCTSNSKTSKRAKYSDNSGAVSSGTSPGRRHKKKYKVDRGCDPCCRSFLGINFFILLLLISFFVICAFVTNEYIKNGIEELPKTFNQSLDDVQLYLNNTQYEINTLLRTNFGQLEQELNDQLDKSGLIVKNRLALVSRAVALENLTEIVSSKSRE